MWKWTTSKVTKFQKYHSTKKTFRSCGITPTSEKLQVWTAPVQSHWNWRRTTAAKAPNFRRLQVWPVFGFYTKSLLLVSTLFPFICWMRINGHICIYIYVLCLATCSTSSWIVDTRVIGHVCIFMQAVVAVGVLIGCDRLVLRNCHFNF